MSNIFELHALVKVENPEWVADGKEPLYSKIVRTYEDRSRAEDDLELIRIESGGAYQVITIQHIER